MDYSADATYLREKLEKVTINDILPPSVVRRDAIVKIDVNEFIRSAERQKTERGICPIAGILE